jgi:hypothetical protein
MARALPLAVACAAVLGLAAGQAKAGDDDRALGVSLAYGRVSIPDHEPEGGALVLDYQRGITDVLWLRGAVLGGALRRGGGTTFAGQGVLGVTYALDILKYVPYVNLGLALGMVGGGGIDTAVRPGLDLGGGLDVLAGRSWSYGPFVRLTGYLDDDSLLTVGLRGSYRWGFF